jgi:hypothetical protein
MGITVIAAEHVIITAIIQAVALQEVIVMVLLIAAAAVAIHRAVRHLHAVTLLHLLLRHQVVVAVVVHLREVVAAAADRADHRDNYYKDYTR